MSSATILEPMAATLRDDEPLYEIIDGQRLEIPPMSALACLFANYLGHALNAHALELNLGRAVVEILFHLALPVDRNRRPDVAYVSYERWPKNRAVDPDVNAWDVVPNIAVESVSPNDLVDGLATKIDEYFQAGVELVWVIHPRQRRIDFYQSPTDVRILTASDVLDGGNALPGFRLPLTEIFGN